MVVAQPAPSFRGGGGRAQRGPGRGRRRGRGRGNAAPRTRQAAQLPTSGGRDSMGLRLRNTEILATEGKFERLLFSPGITKLPLLDAQAKTFTRYELHSCSIAWKSTAATTDQGQVMFGIAPGNALDDVKSETDILRLRPFRVHAVWRSDNITVGKQIMSLDHMFCCTDATKADDFKVAFTVYAKGVTGKGYWQITYDVTMSHPNP